MRQQHVNRRRALSGVLFVALTLRAAAPALAQTTDEEKRVAMTNAFHAGAEAYKAGQYQAAAEAFEKAYTWVASPALLFSAAQAYRRLYLATPSPASLSRAIALYREYLRVDPQAGRREDAMEALQTLVPLERITVTMPGQDPADPAATPADPKRTARLLLSTGVEGGEVALDKEGYKPSPLIAQVEPGAHKVRFRAPGHEETEISVDAVANVQVQRHVDLKAKPAMLDVKGPSDATVSVDGKAVAQLPISSPISVDPGSHFVAVTLRGRAPFSGRYEAEANKPLPITADLPMTTQRKVAWAGLGVSALGLGATGILTGLTFTRQGEALALQNRPADAPLSVEELATFNRSVDERNAFSQAGIITGVATGILLFSSVGLFVLDESPVVVPSAAPAKPSTRTTLEVGLGSAGLRIEF